MTMAKPQLEPPDDGSFDERLSAAKALNAEAERLLNAAEAATDAVERRRLLGLFEIAISTAESAVRPYIAAPP
jgi:hypothetical protein